MIGTYGEIIFETSSNKIFTPQTFTKSGAAVWADHPMLYKKPRREFMHSECRKIEMEIKLNAAYGINPRTAIDKLYKYMENGKRYPLVIGGKPVSNYYMSIFSVSDAWDTVYDDGTLIRATVTVSMEETPQ